MTVYVITDTHFYHNNIIEYTKRPLCHNELLIYNWNKIVKNHDTVYHLGDLYLTNDKEKVEKTLRSLNGIKYLIPGNHDKQKKWKFIENCGFTVLKNRYYDLEQLDYTIRLKHHPYQDIKGNYDFAIFGHYHNNEKQIYFPEYRGINIAPEWFGFKPIDVYEIIEMWEKFFKRLHR